MFGGSSQELDPFRTSDPGTAVRGGRLVRSWRAHTRRELRERHSLYDRPARSGGRPDPQQRPEWQEHIQPRTVRVLAEQTGGIAVVNQNDF
jgi:hypothetical protein